MLFTLAIGLLGFADAKALHKRAAISTSQRNSAVVGSLGSTGATTTINSGITYWLSGASVHNVYGNLNNYGNLMISQTDNPLSIYGGQTSDWTSLSNTDGILNNYAGASIILNDVSASSAPTYDWFLQTFQNAGTIQWCGRGDTGGSTYNLVCSGTCTNNGLIVYEQVRGNLGTAASWRNLVQTTYGVNGQNIYNNGGFLMRQMRVDFSQNVYGTNGCYMLQNNAVMYLQDGVGYFQNPTYAPSFSGQSISFLDSTGTLHMDTAVYSKAPNFGARIYGFGGGNAIEFIQIISSFTYSASTGLLSVSFVGGNSVNLNIGTGYLAAGFKQTYNPTFYGSYNCIKYPGTAPSGSLSGAAPASCQLTTGVCSDLSGYNLAGPASSTSPATPAGPTATSTITGPVPGTTTVSQVVIITVTPTITSTQYVAGPTAGSSTSSNVLVITTVPTGPTATSTVTGPLAGTTTVNQVVIITVTPTVTSTQYVAGPTGGSTTSSGVLIITTVPTGPTATSTVTGALAGTTTVNQVVIVTVTPTITLTQYVSGPTAGSSTSSGVLIVTTVPTAGPAGPTATSYTTGPVPGTTTVSQVVIITVTPTITSTTYVSGPTAGVSTSSNVLVITTVAPAGPAGPTATSFITGSVPGTTTVNQVVIITVTPTITSTSFVAGPTPGSSTSSGILVVTTVISTSTLTADTVTKVTTATLGGSATANPSSGTACSTPPQVATAVTGYTLEWSGLTSAADGAGFLAYSTSQTYDITSCAASCSAASSCAFFNIYQEQDSCNDFRIICVQWAQDKPSSSATNSYNNGRPISYSAGYVKVSSGSGSVSSAQTSASAANTAGNVAGTTAANTAAASSSSTIPSSQTSCPAVTSALPAGYTLEWGSKNAAANCQGYIWSYVMATYDVSACAASCDSQSNCVFFNTYVDQVSGNYENVCVTWSQDQPFSACGTNTYNNGKPICNSNGYSKVSSGSGSGDSATTKATTGISGPTGSPATLANSVTSSKTSSAPLATDSPLGYTLEWTGSSAADGAGYVAYSSIPTYSAVTCAAKCDASPSCLFFNLYQETDSSGNVQNTCVLWSQDKPISTATNTGGSKSFSNSQGWIKNTTSTTAVPASSTGSSSTSSSTGVVGFTQIWTGRSGAAACAGYLSGYVLASRSPSACANSCTLDSRCIFFNIYDEYVTQSTVETVCTLFQKSQDATCANVSYNAGKQVSASDGYLATTSSGSTAAFCS